MYLQDYEELKAQKKAIDRAFKSGKVSEKSSKIKVEELDRKIKEYEEESQLRKAGLPGAKIRNGHFVTELNCPCGYEGIFTYGKMDFKPLGKDRKGFLYFECPKCKRHLQYDPLNKRIKIQKGLLGFLFGKYN